MQDDFMSVTDHYDRLVNSLDPATRMVYDSTKHARVETGYRGRNFIIYSMIGRTPHVLDRIIVNDFNCDDEHGATAELLSVQTGKTLIVGYAPMQILRHPVFVCIPLHAKIRWSGDGKSDVNSGSLAFPLLVRTQSRLHLREKGVTYFETGPTFGQEFDAPSQQ